MTAFVGGTDAARRRLDVPWMAFAAGAAVAASLASAVVLRVESPADAADVVLGGAAIGVCVPLLALSMVARACRYGRLDDSVFAESRRGANLRGLVFGVAVVAVTRTAVLAAVLGSVAAFVAHGRVQDGFADAVRVAAIGGLAGFSYAALFVLGSLFGRRGGGRGFLFVLDVIFGGGSHGLAVLWPRPHIRSLLGGTHVLGMPAWASGCVLALLVIAYLGGSLARTPR